MTDLVLEDLGIRQIEISDLIHMEDYWFNPGNLEYHLRRGGDPNQWMDWAKESVLLSESVGKPFSEHENTTAIVTYRGEPIGHIPVRFLREPDKRRMHFHMWRNRLTNSNLGDTVIVTKHIITLSLRYFFTHYELDDMVGDVAVSNRPANYVLKSMGLAPEEVLMAAYLGDEMEYNRYKFRRHHFLPKM